MKKQIITKILLLFLLSAVGFSICTDRRNTITPKIAEPTQAVLQDPTVVCEIEPEATTVETIPFSMPQITWKDFDDSYVLTAGKAFIYDCQTESYLYCKGEPTDRVYIASITKLFSIYVASQYLDPAQEVTVGSGHLSRIHTNSSVAGLRIGEIVTVDQLYGGMLMPSGNDASYVLATAAGRACAEDPSLSVGTAIGVFVEEMNRQVQELGLVGTHFVNPDGYHNTNHYSCFDDLVVIAKLSMNNDIVMAYANTSTAIISPVVGRTKEWENTNPLINPSSEFYCPYATGLKTGYTITAGNCLLSTFDIEGKQYIIGVFGCPAYNSRFSDTLYLFNSIVIKG